MTIQKAKEALQHYYGYSSFRPMQQEIIQSIYEGKDTLVLMPTGGGKSICFQIPAITMDGIGIVVSPLIALMKDQVEGLKTNGIRATYMNSSQNLSEQRAIEEGIYKKAYDLVYVSPEKLLTQDFNDILTRISINLFAIDEAHCISAWGHDFRPEYARLNFLKKQFPQIPIVACTATADEVTRRDMVKQLAMKQPKEFVASFDRPNLSLEVRSGIKRFEQIVAFLMERPNQSGIIYCLSRKSTETIAAKLVRSGFRAAHYHAGMPSDERDHTQAAFTKDETPIICATIAFGMGIDKSNVRWVIHYNMPKNIEGFYQEIGRAGRDGAAADTLLFYSYNDFSTWQEIINKNNNNQNEVKLGKLKRMQQYATTVFCRRKVLLNYFSENWRENCGNCDVCKNPPNYFDGTVIAQKALSAIYRVRQQIGLNLLIDLLRGSKRKEILDHQLHKVKTYGAGKEYSYQEWKYYLEQLLDQGYLKIAHDDRNRIKLTAASQAVLFDKESVQLVQLSTLKERSAASQAKAQNSTQAVRQRVRDGLFEHLRQLRRDIAQLDGIPPYVVFSDATLEEMAATKPSNETEMKNISGVGTMKWKKYGLQFLRAIKTYHQENETTN